LEVLYLKGDRSTGQFTGKGFYIVLLLCVAVIGVAGFTLMRSTNSLTVNPVQNTPWTFPAATPSIAPPAGNISSPSPRPSPADENRSAENVTPQPSPQPAATVAPTPVPVINEYEEAQEVAAVSFFVRPVEAALPTMFAEDELTYNPTLGVWRFHGGIDIYAELGTPVMAVADGEVERVDIDMLLGNLVVIRHAGGVISLYANLDDALFVSIGDRVSAGDVIGAIGDSAPGKALQAAHLHFEMRQDGEVVNPLKYLPG